MNRLIVRLPLIVTLAAVAAMLAYGPIAQPARYHDFAAVTAWFGLPHAADVLSNLGFALVGVWGWLRLAPRSGHPALRDGWWGYRLLLAGLVLTAVGSGWYHLAPDDYRLIWDRLPIALACAGLLAAVRAETVGSRAPREEAALFALLAVASVAWWHFTNDGGDGDLRPYLLLQGLPLLLIPLWQAIHSAARAERRLFGAALLLYLVAKVVELLDHQVLALFGSVSGHTLKHLLATLAAALIVGCLVRRVAGRQNTPDRTAVAPAADGRQPG
ncbi:MAG: hypothetical protein HYU78_00635 [Rhodocyclales bacterium]|nr:hypothetical protein [Rhodocyclales bacterium]